MHPIQSFAGFNAENILASQTLADSLAPLGMLEKQGGWVVMLGTDHTTNTSIHYAEKLAGRPQFVRWALTPAGVNECPGFPGDSAGFQAVAPRMEKFTHRIQIGDALVQAMPLTTLFEVVYAMIKKDPLALLCQLEDCERCNQIRVLLNK
jgi:aminoglycoside 3-N-acetyltransferase